MRVRKIHAVLAVSVALVIVARSIDGRRRAQSGFPPEPVGDLPDVGRVDLMTIEPVPEPPEAELVALEEPVAAEPELPSEEPPVPASAGVESDVPSIQKRHPRRGPLVIAAAAIVLVAVLAGTVLAVAAVAASSPRASHHHTPESFLHH